MNEWENNYHDLDFVCFGNSPVAVDDQTDLGIVYLFADEAAAKMIVAAFCDLGYVAALLAFVAVVVEVFAII